MSEHFTRLTVSAAAWCPRCQRTTQHRVTDHKLSGCLDCIARPPAPKPQPAPQLPLFGGAD